MPVERWSIAQVETLAPDASSLRNARGVTGQFSATGSLDEILWGLCRGYQVAVDLSDPAFKCSCPSRKIPCKHALGLLLRWAESGVAEWPAPEFATAWQAARAARAKPRAASTPDPVAAARRAQERADRVAGGMTELRRWLDDQVEQGLAGFARAGRQAFEPMAARLVDAQAPGPAGALRRLGGLAGIGPQWADRVLGELAMLRLLVTAHARLDSLDPALAATVRSRIGFPTSTEDVLAGPRVSDRWQVLGQTESDDGALTTRRTWLRGAATGRFALVLSFAAPGQVLAADLVPGTEFRGDLCFYPGAAPLRALVAERVSAAEPFGSPDGAGSIRPALAGWASLLAAEPWRYDAPMLLADVVPGVGGYLVDAEGDAVPLAPGHREPWWLLAAAGARPAAVAGEWTPAGLRPLAAWVDGSFVPAGAPVPDFGARREPELPAELLAAALVGTGRRPWTSESVQVGGVQVRFGVPAAARFPGHRSPSDQASSPIRASPPDQASSPTPTDQPSSSLQTSPSAQLSAPDPASPPTPTSPADQPSSPDHPSPPTPTSPPDQPSSSLQTSPSAQLSAPDRASPRTPTSPPDQPSSALQTSPSAAQLSPPERAAGAARVERMPAAASLSEQAAGTAGAEPVSAAASLLEAAAVALTCRRAGTAPDRGREPIAAAPAEVEPLLPAAASARLARILGGGSPGGSHLEQELLAQWLAAAADRGGLVPPAMLPILLEAGRRNTTIRTELARVAGRRGAWLAEQRGDWRWLLDEAVPVSVTDWHTATGAERLSHLASLRHTDPDRARELVESEWRTESWENRVRFLSTFSIGLSLQDEPLLETALDDRRKEVRETALDLLRHLPGAQLGRRMAGRAHAAVRLAGRDRLLVDPPEELDPALRRDGVGAAPTRGIGAGAWLLEEVLAGTPLETWTGLDPAGYLELARRHDWANPLMHGWAKAAVTQRDEAWAAALLDTDSGTLREAVRWDLHLVLPPDRLARLAADALRAEDGSAHRLLALHPGPWPDHLAAAVLETIATRARTDRHTWQLGELCRTAALAMPPAYADLAGRLAAQLDQIVDPTRVRPVTDLARALTFRHDMLQELQ